MKLKKDGLKKILSKFEKAKILVVGDLILDEYIWGRADRISPEAPVPVVWAESQSYLPGGACNVANNIVSLGGQVFLCGVVGDDKNGAVLTEKLREKNVNCDGVILDSLRPTTVKTRIIASHQQVVRVDWENVQQLYPDRAKAIIEAVKTKISDVDALVIEDYGKGLISPPLAKAIIDIAKKHAKIITVDPKVEHFSSYKGVTAITPNEKEASVASGVRIENLEDVDRAGRKLLNRLKCEGVLITLGEKGMKLFEGDRVTHIPTVAQEVFDVSGAGDTVIAVFTLALASGVSMQEATKIANVVAGIVVGKVGVAVAAKDEIWQAWNRLKGRI